MQPDPKNWWDRSHHGTKSIEITLSAAIMGNPLWSDQRGDSISDGVNILELADERARMGLFLLCSTLQKSQIPWMQNFTCSHECCKEETRRFVISSKIGWRWNCSTWKKKWQNIFERRILWWWENAMKSSIVDEPTFVSLMKLTWFDIDALKVVSKGSTYAG